MTRKLLRKLGFLKTSLLITGSAILCSIGLYLISYIFTGEILLRGLLISIFIPAIVAPLLSYGFLRGLIRLEKSEEEARKSEERYRNILEKIEEGYFEVDLKGDLTFFNESLCRMSGYPRNELMGMNNRDYTNPETAKRMYEVFNGVYRTGEPVSTRDYEIIRKDGSRRILELSVSLVKDSLGHRIGFRGVARDVTEHKRAEEALAQSEQRFRSIVENSHAGVLILDDAYRFNYVNQQFCSIPGYSREEIMGQDFRKFLDEASKQLIVERYERRQKGEEVPSVYEFNIVSKSGEKRRVETSSTVIKDSEGRPQTIAQILDITDRKQAEERLRESEAKYRELVQNANSIIIRTDTEGNITFFNEFAQSFFGYSEEEIIGRNLVGSIVPEKDAAGRDLAAMIEDILVHPENYALNENENMCRNGERVWVGWTNKAIRDKDGNVTGILCIGNDITSRRRLEEQLRQAQKTEAIGTLAGGIAHDFNNLLMAIQGNASILLHGIDSSHPHYESLTNIEQQARSGAKLTRQLLGYARKGNYEVRPMNLNQLVTETAGTFGRARKDITVHLELSEDLSAIEADQGQIEQVLLNLYLNAADAMPDGGDLVLTTRNVTHENVRNKTYNPKPGKYVLLTVTDTGAGMEKGIRKRIFDPFFTTKEMGRGTGLGLASVYGIIKGHGGYIDVESESGHGTTFNIYLPASKQNIHTEPEIPRYSIEGAGTILLVDDEEMVLNVGAKLLENLGYNAFAAKSGIEAVEMYEENRDHIDIIILDMIMPQMSGGETYDRLKKINPDVRVLLSSGYSVDGQAKEILNRGCDEFIQKPFGMEELSQKLRQMLGRNEKSLQECVEH